METKKRRKKYVRRTPESYREEVEKITNGEYSVLGDFVRMHTKILHAHNKCNHSWEIRPNDFIDRGSRCPKCYGRKIRSPESYRKEVSAITDGEYSVLGQYLNSTSKITHRHNGCGHEWEVSPNVFVNIGSRCPLCFGKSESMSRELFPRKVFELVGDEYTFLENYKGSHTKITVRHNRSCGNIYEVSPSSFIHGGARCSCHARKTDAEFREEVKALVGVEYSVVGYYRVGYEKIRMRHNICGHSYKTTPNNFLRGSRCTNCVYSRGEKAVADVLDSLSIEYSREHSFKYLGRKRFDFFIPSLNIAIEYDGEQHYKSIDAWGGEEYLESVRQSDALKNDFCEYMGIDLLRIPYWEFDNIDEIVTNFIDTVKLMRSISASGSEMPKCR